MLRSLITASALVLAAAPAPAASYSARLATPVTQHIMASDIRWSCGADACQGATEESRPVVLCEGLAKRAGKVESFLVDGRAFTQPELTECNRAVKSSPAKALAAQ